MHPKLKRCFICGQYANILFLLFALFASVYYWSINRHNLEFVALEIAAYTVEVGGFVFMMISLYHFHKIVRHRYIMKTAMLIYIVTEIVIMILDFNAEKLTFYHSASMALNLFHSIFSAVICFTYLSLEPKNTSLEITIIITEIIILSGMFGVVFGLHIYISLFANSIAYVVFFSVMRFLLSQERIMIDCHGDKPKAFKFKSSFFDE